MRKRLADCSITGIKRDTSNCLLQDMFNNFGDRGLVFVDNVKVRGFEVVSTCQGEDIILPKRSTGKSAGYDFFAVRDIIIPSSYSNFDTTDVNMEKVKGWDIVPTLVKTGIKAYMQDDEVLLLYNRSSNPKKLGLVLANGVGVVDSDYYNNPDNEGEIGFMFYNLKMHSVTIKKGDKIGQGIFQKWYLADADSFSGSQRVGGFGSTGK